MQLKKLILFILLLFAPLFIQAELIDNNEEIILKGNFSIDTILKIKVFNNDYPDDIHYTFVEAQQGSYSLTKADIDLKRLKDGEITFEIRSNNSSMDESYTHYKTLDKGLFLTFKVSNGMEYEGDKYINASEQLSIFIDGETEPNVQTMELSIVDEKNQVIKFSLKDLNLDENSNFSLKNIYLSTLVDGAIKFKVTATDDIGNANSYEVDMIKDTVVEKPILLKRIKNNNLSNVVNKKILVASGTAEPFATVSMVFKQGSEEATENIQADKDGNWELLGGDLDISVFGSYDVQVAISQTDLAQNVSQKEMVTYKKFKKPIFPLVPLPIDPIKYQLVHTIDSFSDEIKSIAITDEEIFVGTYKLLKVFGKSYAKEKREVAIRDSWVNTIKVFDGKVFAGLSNGNIKIFDEKTLRAIATIGVEKLPILNIDISQNQLIVTSGSGAVSVYDATTYKGIYRIKNHQWDVGAMAIVGSVLYTGSDDYSIKSWDLVTQKRIKTLKSAHSGTINAIIVHDNMLISASDDKTIIIRDIKTGEVLRVLKGHKKAVNRLSITNNFLVSVGSDRAIILWDMKTGEILKKLKGHSKRIMALAVNDENLVTGSRDYKLKIWGYDDSRDSLDGEDETNKPIFAMVKSFKASPQPITALTQSENNILASAHGHIYFFNKFTYNPVKSYSTMDEIEKPKKLKRREQRAVSSTDDSELQFDLDEEEESEDGEEEEELPLKLQTIYDIKILGSSLLASLDDSTVKVWNLETDKSVLSILGNELASTSVAIGTVNIFVGSKKGSVGMYDIESKQLVNLLEGHQYNVNTVAIYNDEWIVSAGDDYSIKIRDIETGDLVLNIKNAHNDTINEIIIQEKMLISASDDGSIKIRDIESGKLIRVLRNHESGVTSLDADEEYLISGSRDKNLMVYSMKDFRYISTMSGHKDEVTDVMITDDYIVSSSKDKTIKVWKYYE